MSLTHLQIEVGGWDEETFPLSTMESCLEHLRREVKEFRASGDRWEDYDPEELADCFLILLHIAHKMNVSIEEESRKKFAVNKTRSWGKPDASGVVEHIREVGT